MPKPKQSRPFSRRFNCRRAAIAALGADAAFEILEVVGGFAYRAIDVADLPPTRVDGKPKPGPGLVRLRASPEAEAIRQGAIADQAAEKARQAAKAGIGGTDAAIDLPAFLGRPAPAKAAPSGEKPLADRKTAAKAEKPLGKRAAILAAAQAGILPTPPDFTAETHKRFRGKLADLVALAAAGDVAGLKAYAINPISSSPKALDRYRNLCVMALGAGRA
ncbi:MAG: hypothetical protein KDJ20_07930 [Hyphomicrobiales bacterium]|nr:hypothetical protein [Hyphomicrobiales bacterium]MCC2108198.1 hypothetical protein [Hyphomicrobiales bacterium]MCC2111739.1 hypothetical protein [Hyphomicrobiales bacterium]